MKQKNFQNFLYSTAGVVGMIIALLAFYVISSTVKQRVDLTVDKAYTLSPGTKAILGKLKSNVTIRFYCTQGENMPVQLKNYGQHIEDLLAEYKQASHGRIIVQKFDPSPDSDAEENAKVNGVEGQATSAFGDKVYLGLVVSVAEQKVAIPWLAMDREKMLEYDVSRAISRVQDPEPPVLGVMSGLPVFGERANPMMGQAGQRSASDPWVFISELQKDFTVRSVVMSATKIDDDIKVLVVIHPKGITPATQYALDQFVLRGGRLLAMVDPHAYFDQKHDQMAQMMGDSSGQSTLDTLFKAWGIDMDTSRVVADLNFGIRNRGNVIPSLLALDRKGINEDDAITSQIDNVVLPFAGTFTGKPVDGIKETILLRSSPNSELVDSTLSSVGGEQIVKDFKASGTNYAFAVRLTGKFKTAFPEGKPAEKKDPKAPATEKKADDSAPQLKESTANGVVILIADTDMIADPVCVEVQDVMGYKVVRTPNGNLNFVQSLVEQLAGDSNLISLRSRASLSRPFTRVRNMEAAAEQKYQAKIKQLEASLAETQQKLQELQSTKQDAQQRFILSPEQQKAVDQYHKTEADAKKDLKQLRKDLRKDTDKLAFVTKVVNIAAMPVLVALTGIVLAVVKRKKTAAK